MKESPVPAGIDYGRPKSTNPTTAAEVVKPINNQFGVADNQPDDLREKAQADLANKAAVQKNG